MAEIKIDKDTFWSRYADLDKNWKTGGKNWGDGKTCDALLLINGEAEEDETMYSRSTAMQNLLIGYEMSDVIFLITEKKFYMLAGSKKIKYMTVVGSAETVKGQDLKLEHITKSKGDGLQDDLQTLLGHFRESKSGKILGIIKKDYEKCKGKLAKKLRAAITEAGVDLVDVGVGFGGVLAIKDSAGLACINKAAQYSTQVLRKYLLPELETVIDEETIIKHSALAEKTEDVFQDPTKIKIKMKPENLDSCYTPIIQSGGNYDLKPSAQSDDNELHYGVIVCSLGARYKNFCSNIARTYFINPSTDMKTVYGILLQVYGKVKANLKPGKKMSDCYKAAMTTIQNSSRPELKFTKNCGFGIGLEFRESSLLLSEKNNRLIAENMVFNVSIGFEQVTTKDQEKRKDPKSATYAILLSDTFKITADEPEAFTHCKREWSEVSYFIGDDEEEEEDVSVKEEKTTRGKETRSADDKRVEMREHQKKLEKDMREKAMKEYANGASVKGADASGKIESYDSVKSFPKKVNPNHIVVDGEHESVILPVCGQMIPFHIGTIKNVQKDGGDAAGEAMTIRIQFLVPGESGNAKPVSISDDKKIFIRELSFKSTSEKFLRAFHHIQQLRKAYLVSTKERITKASLVVQEDLIINKKNGPLAKLRDVSIRPVLSRKKAAGILVAHENGFRYTSSDKLKLDIIYTNIKQAFFQPAKKTHHVLLHLELKNPIKMDAKGSKKTHYVQFFDEVVEQSQDISARGGNYHDEDGLLEEQNERRKRTRANEGFHKFVKKVETEVPKVRESNPTLEFDIPYDELAFQGVAHRESVKIYPTVHSLVALHDNPPLVINLNDIQIANFERVQFSLRNFDLAFIFKEWERLPFRIDTIPSESLEAIRKWLNSCDIKYYETNQNMLWKNVMKMVQKDIPGFLEDGGWATVLGDDEGEEGDDEEDEESDFEPEEEDSEDEDSEEYESAEEEGESSSDESDEEEDEDEGEDWDELEKNAKEDDRELGIKEKETDREERKKKPAYSSSKPSTSKKPAPSRKKQRK